MTVIKSAVIKAYDAAAHKATVQIAGSLGVWLDGIRVATDIPAADVVAGRQCTVLFLDPSNQDDAVVITIQGALPSGGGGQNPLFASAMIPGAVTTGVEPPNVPAFYGGTATEIYFRAKGTYAACTATIHHYNQAGVEQNTQSVVMGAALYKTQAIEWTITENDYFYIEVTSVTGNPTNLVWQVRP